MTQCVLAMSEYPLPIVRARVAVQPEGVEWPGDEWPRAHHRRQRRLEEVVDEAFTRADLAETFAVVVVQGGRVLAERYAGHLEYFDRPAEAVTSSTPLLSWSMAKSMLHCVVGTLVDDGRLDPAQRASVPEWTGADDPRRAVRLADLLAMRDGLAFIEEYEIGETSHVIEMLFGEGRDDVAAYAARVPLAHPPGSTFNYSSGTSNIVSRIVADVVGYGEAYREYLTTRLFTPLGMDSAVATFDARGVFVASSYVHACALDFARFGLLYLRGGQWRDTQVISRDWAATAQIPRSVDPESGAFYSWQWWVSGDRYGTYWASGFEGQSISVAPVLDAVVVRCGRTPAQNYPALYDWRGRVLDVLDDGTYALS